MPTKVCSGLRTCDLHREEAAQADQQIKEFVVIGNGPSGISLSYLLSGNWPYYVGESQDEFLHTRLQVEPDLSLVEQDLEFLSDGLEGRSNNPVSLLLDCLQRPQADLGLDLPSLLEWRNDPSQRSNHVVLGRGKPGGVWQTLDGNLKTVSQGGWMQLPNLSMPEWEEHNTALVNRRTSVASVAEYYVDYVNIMGLTENFRNHTVVSAVKQVKKDWCSSPCRFPPEESDITETSFKDLPEVEDVFSLDSDELSSQCSSLTHHSASPSRDLTDHRIEEATDRGSEGRWLPDGWYEDQCSLERWSRGRCSLEGGSRDHCSVGGGSRGHGSESPCSCLTEPNYCDTEDRNVFSGHLDILYIPGLDTELCPSWDPIINPSLFNLPFKSSVPPRGSFLLKNSISKSYSCPERFGSDASLYEVSGYEIQTSDSGERETKHFTYLTKNVVLATGLDKPNRLGVQGEEQSFVLHSLRELERAVQKGGLTPNSDPIMIIGAGLSAADAIISAQGYGIPVVHVFRKSVDSPQLIFKKLPVNLYPEYHKVHKMMAEGSLDNQLVMRGEVVEREHPKYRAFSETVVGSISKDRRVQITGPNTDTEIQVSYVLVLIGAAPNLEFLEAKDELGRIDKNHPLDIDVYTHQSVNIPGLFAMGPLTGDNFVRFLQGGALAIASYAHTQRRAKEKLKNH